MTEKTAPEEMSSAYEPAAVEAHWYPLWEKSGCFQPAAGGKKPYCIVIPPPNVTGSLHIGHALNNTLQDTLVRHHRMRGYDVLWQPGTDHAGIATQMVVERMLDKEGTSRHALGRDAFLKRVWTWKEESGSTITRQLRRLGASPDWSRERFTMDEGLSRAVRKVFVELYKQKLIYRDKRLVNWDPKLHTAISDLEVEQRDTKGNLWHFRYPIEGMPGAFITVATTRPETMLGDSAVAVHPTDERYKALVGKHVLLPLVGRRIPIVADEYSDPEKGTGAVKITPAHDFNDFEVGRRHALPLFNIFDANAKLNDSVPEPYRGLDRFEARKRVVADLEALGLLDQIVPHPHMVPHGDRSGVVIEPWLTDQWYVDAATLAKPAVAAVESGKTEFVPKHWDKTFFEWMKNIQPWCISRQLWWGHQIPVWYGPDGTMFCEDTDEAVYAAAKLHYGRDVELTRDADVLDTWFSSALWPFSTLGWPDQTPELGRFYPTSVLVTSFDIIFFWVARMMMMGLHFMHEVPFRHVYIHALVRDEHGQKMSKSKGNIVDPLSVIDEHGCDALRFTLIALAMQGRDIKLSVDRIAGYRAFANKIWNASRFALMRLEGTTPLPLAEVTAQLEDADRFILSRLAATVGEVNAALGEYRFAEAAASMYAFFWNEFCDWYIELVKPRLLGDASPSRTAAASTLVHVLDQALRLLHPMMPFITEEIWHKLPITRPTEFIATAPYPTDSTTWANPAVEAAYALMQSAIVAIRGVRADYGIAFAKALEVTMIVPGAAERAILEKVAPEIVSMAKVGELKIVAAAEKPLGSAVKVLEKVEVVVSLRGLVDFEQEATRLEKQVLKTEAERDRIVKKLANEKFVANAPADVVATDRARVLELDGMLASLRQAVSQNRAAAREASA